MSNTANETTQPTETPLWREARYHGHMWREEYSDIKLESTKLQKKIREKKLCEIPNPNLS